MHTINIENLNGVLHYRAILKVHNEKKNYTTTLKSFINYFFLFLCKTNLFALKIALTNNVHTKNKTKNLNRLDYPFMGCLPRGSTNLEVFVIVDLLAVTVAVALVVGAADSETVLEFVVEPKD